MSQESKYSDEDIRKRLLQRHVQSSYSNFLRTFHKAYEPTWYHEYIASRLETLVYETDKRLMILMPPRHGKSFMSSENFPAYYLGKSYALHGEPRDIILLSYSDGFAKDFGRRNRNIMQTPEYSLYFHGLTISQDQSSADKWETSSGQRFKSVGRGGQATGRGAHLLIIDDLIKNQEEADSKTVKDSIWESLLKSTIYSRLEEGANIVCVNTRWSEDDPVGRMLKEWEHEDWEVIELPVIADKTVQLGEHTFRDGDILWDSRYTPERIDRIRKAIGAGAFETIFMQRPSVRGGEVFLLEWFRYYRQVPTSGWRAKIQSWDTAHDKKTANDYSVCTTWLSTDEGYFLIDMYREKLQFPELKTVAVSKFNEFEPDYVIIEQKASGIPLTQEIERNTNIRVLKEKPIVDKVARANAVTPVFENGEIFLPEPTVFKYSWLNSFISEMVAFPKAGHDDIVDSTTQAIKHLSKASRVNIRVL